MQDGYDVNRARSIAPAGVTASADGGLVGLYGGYNVQVDNIVFGIDTSINYDGQASRKTGVGGTAKNMSGAKSRSVRRLKR